LITVQKKPQATKCSDHRTISLIAHTAKIVARILRRGIERKIEGAFGEYKFEFRRGKGTRDPIGMLRIISERTLDIDEELCACFIDWQKPFDRVNWTKLMQFLKGTRIAWRRIRLRIRISTLYVDQGVKLNMGQGQTRSVKIGRGVKTRMLFVIDSIQRIQRVPYQGCS
jgi:hypothetical protein